MEHHRLPGNDWQWEVHMWPQSWAGGDCGFGGMSVASSHKVPTVVFRHGKDHAVYHNGRFAYMGDGRYGLFVSAFNRHQLPGQVDWEKLKPSDKWLENNQ